MMNLLSSKLVSTIAVSALTSAIVTTAIVFKDVIFGKQQDHNKNVDTEDIAQETTNNNIITYDVPLSIDEWKQHGGIKPEAGTVAYVKSASGNTVYKVCVNTYTECTCPAWRYCKGPTEKRTCKHCKAVFNTPAPA